MIHSKLAKLLAGCASLAMMATALPARAAPPTKPIPITLALSWLPEAEFCGFYEAKAKGFYAQKGLDVTIQPGGPEVNVGLLLASGNVDFALSDALGTLNQRTSKLPIVAVAAYFQKDPQTLVAHPDPDIHTLADLKGHPIMIANAQRSGYWNWVKAKFGLTDEQLRPYAFSAAPFLADPKAAQQGYVTNDGYILAKPLGQEPKIFLLADAGYIAYSNTLDTQEKTIKQNPAMIRKFVSANSEGWKSCLHGDFAAARDMVAAANPKYPADLFNYSMKEMIARKLVQGDEGGAIGRMTNAKWAEIYNTMSSLGVLRKDIDYKSAYTLEFVPSMQ